MRRRDGYQVDREEGGIHSVRGQKPIFRSSIDSPSRIPIFHISRSTRQSLLTSSRKNPTEAARPLLSGASGIWTGTLPSWEDTLNYIPTLLPIPPPSPSPPATHALPLFRQGISPRLLRLSTTQASPTVPDRLPYPALHPHRPFDSVDQSGNRVGSIETDGL